MSFEFERPTCYSPNGLVFGVLREGHAYSAPCRTFAGGPIDNRIVWYFVPRENPVYEGLSAFEPRVDNIYDLKHETFEVSALRPCPRKHYDGRDLWFRDATDVIGDAQDFAGQSTADKCHCQEGPPHPPCVTGPHAFNMVLFGVDPSKALDGEVEGGLRLGGVTTKSLDLTAAGRLALGARLTYFPPPPLELDAGLALGDVLKGLSVDGPTIPAGLALGDVLTFIPPPPLELAAGLALGDVLDVAAADPLELDAGLALGDVLTPKALELDAGLALGDVTTPIPPTSVAATELGSGLSLGMVASVPAGTTGGANCDASVEMTADVEYTVDVLSGTEQWFFFNEPAFSTVHWKRLSSSGGSGQIDTYQGTSCASKSTLEVLDFDGECVSTSSMGVTKVFLKCKHNSGGTFHVTFVWGLGGCP